MNHPAGDEPPRPYGREFPYGPGEFVFLRPRRKTGLIVGIALAVVVVVAGGITAFVLLAGGERTDGGPRPEAPPPENSTAVASAPRTVTKGPREAADAITAAYRAADRQALQGLLCAGNPQQFPAIPPGVVMTVSGEPRIEGTSAFVPVHATGPVRYNDFQLGLRLEGGVWCYASDKAP